MFFLLVDEDYKQTRKRPRYGLVVCKVAFSLQSFFASALLVVNEAVLLKKKDPSGPKLVSSSGFLVILTLSLRRWLCVGRMGWDHGLNVAGRPIGVLECCPRYALYGKFPNSLFRNCNPIWILDLYMYALIMYRGRSIVRVFVILNFSNTIKVLVWLI